jgi:sporulation protein YlmC with PRC-barrel domain
MKTTNLHRSSSILTALTLSLLAGTCPVATAQPDADDRMAAPRANADRPAAYWSCHSLKGMDVTGTDGKEIAEVTDAVLDRGSGRVDFVVVKTGTILGMGGKTVAVPYAAMRWNGAEKTVALNATAEELKAYPAFSADEWTALTEKRNDRKAEPRRDLYGRLNSDNAPYSDPYHDSLKDARRTEVKGTVESVERNRSSAYGEQVVLNVKTDSGESRRIALGPSWFVSGSDVSPVRGDRVEIETLDIPRDNIAAATRVRIGNRDLTLRDEKSTPTWSQHTGAATGAPSANTPYWRYVMLSDVRGMKVDCRGNECGKVADVILDRNSGQVAFLSIDPNQNFLGIGDTKRLVPWSVATVSLDGTVRIDAAKEMVIASPETPSDISSLNSGQTSRSVYNAYQISEPRYGDDRSRTDGERLRNTPDKDDRNDTNRPYNDRSRGNERDPSHNTTDHTGNDQPRQSTQAVENNNAWSSDGAIMKAVDRESAHTLKGEITDITDTTFDSGIPNARTLIVRTSSGEQYVLLGPSAYINSMKMPYKKGDTVTANVYRTTINGRHFLIASDLDGRSSRVELWKNNVPAWQR